MKTRRILGIVLVVVVQVWCCRALAEDPVPAISLGANDVLQTNTLGSMSMGWEFTLDCNVIVTHLGVWDDVVEGYPPGFSSDYQMGIYRTSDGALVASATLSAGTPTQLAANGYINNSPYWFVPLASPVTLAAATGENPVHYVVACWTPLESTDYHILFLNEPNGMQVNAAVNPVLHLYSGDWYYGWRSASGMTQLVQPTTPNWNDLLTPNFMFTLEPPQPSVTQIQIDIKPGSYPNSINLGSHGVVPVAILSSATFDARTVNPATVYLAGAGVAVRGKGKLMTHSEDVNGDGLVDLLVQVETENLDPGTFQDGYAGLTAETYGGQALEGWDEITIVPPQ